MTRKKYTAQDVPSSSIMRPGIQLEERKQDAQRLGTQTFSSHLLKVRGCTWVAALRLDSRTW